MITDPVGIALTVCAEARRPLILRASCHSGLRIEIQGEPMRLGQRKLPLFLTGSLESAKGITSRPCCKELPYIHCANAGLCRRSESPRLRNWRFLPIL